MLIERSLFSKEAVVMVRILNQLKTCYCLKIMFTEEVDHYLNMERFVLRRHFDSSWSRDEWNPVRDGGVVLEYFLDGSVIHACCSNYSK